MNDYREYFIAIAAIFLALALGILIGVAFGEDFLVSNQREIIELMEQELARSRRMLQERDDELALWEQVKPLLLRNYESALSDRYIAVLAGREEQAYSVQKIFEESGAGVAVLIFPSALETAAAAEQFMALLQKDGALPPAELAEHGVKLGGSVEPSRLPDCYVLLLDRGGTDPVDRFMLNLWEELHREGKRVIAAFPWQQQEQLTLPPAGAAAAVLNFVDNSDTFWGRIALLELAAYGGSGDYGFGTERLGLLPLHRETP